MSTSFKKEMSHSDRIIVLYAQDLGCHYIVRNPDGKCYAFQHKPQRNSVQDNWLNQYGRSGAYIDHSFSFVSSTDIEPYCIDDWEECII